MKYIDADKLIAEIKRLEEMDYPCDTLEQSEGFYDALDRLKSFIASLQQEQKSAEWSEYDEAMRDNILRLLSYFVGTLECDSNPSLSTSYQRYQREIDWLKSLKPQPKQDWIKEQTKK